MITVGLLKYDSVTDDLEMLDNAERSDMGHLTAL